MLEPQTAVARACPLAHAGRVWPTTIAMNAATPPVHFAETNPRVR
jgi:hypothetical protein